MAARSNYRFIRIGPEVAEIWLGDSRAVKVSPPGEPALMTNGICPHRGGPLALGEFDCRTKSLRCPWHGQQHSLAALRGRALPAIRCGDSWLVAIELPGPVSTDEVVCFRRQRCQSQD